MKDATGRSGARLVMGRALQLARRRGLVTKITCMCVACAISQEALSVSASRDSRARRRSRICFSLSSSEVKNALVKSLEPEKLNILREGRGDLGGGVRDWTDEVNREASRVKDYDGRTQEVKDIE